MKEIISRKGVKKAIKRGELRLNGEVIQGGAWLEPGDTITWVDPENKPPKAYPLKLTVVFEDDFIAVIEKPAGISVSGNHFKTIYNALGDNLKPSSELDALPWPLPTHRLDNQTRGLLIIAKTPKARIQIGKDFEEKKIKKSYHALVVGKPHKEGEVNMPIAGKVANSSYNLIEFTPACKGDYLSLLQLFPHTGRTHQLRIHCAALGTPILGDALYGSEGTILKNKGLFLAATGLVFRHPATKEIISFKLEIPEKFKSRIAYEKRRFLHQGKASF